jgi:hypothetical protein
MSGVREETARDEGFEHIRVLTLMAIAIFRGYRACIEITSKFVN